jgi:hypothetical protein
MGQVLGLLEWAQAMATKDPTRTAMWLDIAQLCRAVDLHALKRLAAAASDD